MSEHSGCVHLCPQVDLRRIRHLVFDMDGTIYKGKTLFPFTKSVFRTLDEIGIGYTFLTNNSSVSAKDYVKKLQKMELPGGKEKIYTSSLATIHYLRNAYPEGRTLYLMGTKSLQEEFREHGFELLGLPDLSISDTFEGVPREPDLVVVAFDMELTYDSLCKAAWWIDQGKPFIATHPDMICPTDLPTVLVDCGAMCACLEAATGRKPDKIVGKPDPEMIAGIMETHRLAPEEVAMVGDRLYTDMEMARLAGVIGALVLSGEATLQTLEKSGLQPEIVVKDISVLADLLSEKY